jgi:hypothetical protein
MDVGEAAVEGGLAMRRHPFIVTAGILFALFIGLHLAGGRECVGVLSGTLVGGPERIYLGLGYALAWFGAVLAAPVLLLAGVADVLLERVGRGTAAQRR